MNDRLYDIEDTRERLGGIGRSTLFLLLKTQQIGSVKVGRRRMVPQSQIDAYIERNLKDDPMGNA